MHIYLSIYLCVYIYIYVWVCVWEYVYNPNLAKTEYHSGIFTRAIYLKRSNTENKVISSSIGNKNVNFG